MAGATEPWLLVGHMPYLGRLASLQLTGDAEREVVAFRMGALVALTGGPRWQVPLILTPELVG